MNFLRRGEVWKTSSNSPQISDIARAIRKGDGACCGAARSSRVLIAVSLSVAYATGSRMPQGQAELLCMKAASMNVHPSLAIGQPIEKLDAISPDAIPPAATAPDAMVRFEGISKIYPAYR